MKRVAILLAILFAVAAVAALLLMRERDDTTRVAADRAATLAGARPAPSDDVEPGRRPEPGTYRFTASGREHLDLLGGSTHEFPDEVYGVVQLDSGDPCAWTFDLVLVEEHVEERSYCTTPSGVRDTGFARTTSFLGREQTSSFACGDEAMRLRADASPGDTWRFTCTERRGGTTRYVATFVGHEQLDIGGERARTAHVRMRATQDDRSTGRERSDWWWLATGLPARIRSDRTLTTTAGPLGTLTTTERFDVRLASLSPERSAP